MMDPISPFLDNVITQLLTRMHDLHANNYDAQRFSFDGVDRSKSYNLQDHKNYLFFFLRNHKAFFEAYQVLEDEASKKMFIDLILFRLAGHLHVKLDTNNPTHWAVREQGEKMAWTPSTMEFTGLEGPLRHYEGVDFEGDKLNFDSWEGGVWAFVFKQYYFDRSGIVIRPEPNDHVIDAGAFLGDTALAFATSVGAGGRVYVFDVIENHLKVIRHNVAQNPTLTDRIKLLPFGLGDVCHAGTPFSSENLLAPGFSLNSLNAEQQAQIPVKTIDSLVKAGQIERVDFIKMDIEGYELRALKGADETIRRFKPKLAISVYHKPEDLAEIPLYIRSLGLGYRMYVDHYTIHSEETVLYAVA